MIVTLGARRRQTLTGTRREVPRSASVSYSCPGGQALSGTSCIGSSTSSASGTPIYGCAAGYTLLGASCTSQGTATTPATAAFTCAGGTSAILSVNHAS